MWSCFNLKKKEELGAESVLCLFPACRPYFAEKHEEYSIRATIASGGRFEDIFWKRQFASTVLKESNVYDHDVDRYAKGIDALLGRTG